jgi:hypothetical protein
MNKWGTMAVAAIAGVTYYNSQDMSTELRVDENQRKFIEWVAVHGKSYPTREEHNMRLARFKNSIAEVARLNAEASQDGQDRAQYSLNKFSDWTADEYQALLGFQGGNGNEESEMNLFLRPKVEKVEVEVEVEADSLITSHLPKIGLQKEL